MKNKEKLRAQQREYRIKNRERIAERRRQDWILNRNGIRERQRSYQRAYPKTDAQREAQRRANREYYENNKEKLKEQQRKYRRDNKEKIREQRKHWKHSQPEHARKRNRRYRRSPSKSISGYYKISSSDCLEMLKNQKGLCAICKKDITEKNFVDHDHVTGKIRGLLCMKCNISLGHVENWYFKNRHTIDTYLLGEKQIETKSELFNW